MSNFHNQNNNINEWDFVLVNIYKSQTIITHCCDSFNFFFFSSFFCQTYGSCLGSKRLLSTCGVLKSNKRRIILTQLMSKCYFKHTHTHNHKIEKKPKKNKYNCLVGQIPLNRYIVYFYCFELCEQKTTENRIIAVLHHTKKLQHRFPWITSIYTWQKI